MAASNLPISPFSDAPHSALFCFICSSAESSFFFVADASSAAAAACLRRLAAASRVRGLVARRLAVDVGAHLLPAAARPLVHARVARLVAAAVVASPSPPWEICPRYFGPQIPLYVLYKWRLTLETD